MILQLSTVIFFLLVFITPQSFAVVKLPFLFLSVCLIAIGVAKGKFRFRSVSVLTYYFMFCLPVLIWAIVGLIRGNPSQAIIEATRVYFVFMWIYALLVLYVSHTEYQAHLAKFFCIVAVGISSFAVYVLLDYVFGLNIISAAIRDEMYLEMARAAYARLVGH